MATTTIPITEPCYVCKADHLSLSFAQENNKRCVYCLNCNTTGPWSDKASTALEGWNERMRRSRYSE